MWRPFSAGNGPGSDSIIHNIIYYNFTSGTVSGVVCKKIVANNIYNTVYVNDNDRPYWCRAYYVDCARRTRSYTSIITLHCCNIYIHKLIMSGRYRKTNDTMIRIINNILDWISINNILNSLHFYNIVLCRGQVWLKRIDYIQNNSKRIFF